MSDLPKITITVETEKGTRTHVMGAQTLGSLKPPTWCELVKARVTDLVRELKA